MQEHHHHESNAEDTSNDNDANCEYCRQDTPHPLWLYCIRDGRIPNVDQVDQNSFYVGLSTQPLVNLNRHNRIDGYRAASKVTNSIKPNWIMELVMPVLPNTPELKRTWRSKRTDNKLVHFVRYLAAVAKTQNTPIYCRDQQALQNMLLRQSDQTVANHTTS